MPDPTTTRYRARDGTEQLVTASRTPEGRSCVLDHRAYDTGRLELLPHLEPQWRAEIAHAVMHLGLIGAARRLAPGRR